MPATLAKPPAPARRNQQPSPAALLAWYERHARPLPWRVGPKARSGGARAEPYRVWLSEVMLQQTTVKAVAPYFLRFVERWPTVSALAAADERDVMAAWAGLGYYSRARKLIECARVVAARPEGLFPETAAELTKLPGIGAYTSAAIAAIAFGEPVAVVDGNVERVIARLFAIDTPFPAAKPLIRETLQPLVPEARAGEFAEALMDLGATICTPRKPACALCPWSEECLSRQKGLEAVLPVKAQKKARPTRYGTAFVARRADGAILLRRRPPKGLLGGMSEVPGSEWGAEPASRINPPLKAGWTRLAVPVDHVFTHFALKLSVERSEVGAKTPAPPGCWWATAPSEEALPSVMKKVIEAAYPGATKTQATKTEATRAKGYEGKGAFVSEIRHIVFDVGRVLIHYDPHLAYVDLITDEEERAAFLREVCTSDWNAEQDRGRAWEDAEAEAIARHPDKADLIRAFRGNWHRMVSHEYAESVAILRALLERGHDVTLLTNFAADTFREAQERYPFLKESRGATVSAEIGLIKPDPAIYAHHTETFELAPESTLFFDDSPANVEAARRAGWKAELFTSAEKMREDLKGYGLELG